MMARDLTGELHVAVVHARDEILYLAAHPDRAAVIREVADYVASHAERYLWDEDARRVASALAADDAEAAVGTYFGALGDPARSVRWERAQLVLRAVPVAGGVTMEG